MNVAPTAANLPEPKPSGLVPPLRKIRYVSCKKSAFDQRAALKQNHLYAQVLVVVWSLTIEVIIAACYEYCTMVLKLSGTSFSLAKAAERARSWCFLFSRCDPLVNHLATAQLASVQDRRKRWGFDSGCLWSAACPQDLIDDDQDADLLFASRTAEKDSQKNHLSVFSVPVAELDS